MSSLVETRHGGTRFQYISVKYHVIITIVTRFYIMLVIKFHFSRAIRSRIGYLLLILVSNRVLPGVVESQKSAFRVSVPRVSEQPYLLKMETNFAIKFEVLVC